MLNIEIINNKLAVIKVTEYNTNDKYNAKQMYEA